MHPIDQIFALSPAIRYVAIYRAGELEFRQRSGVDGASASESDKYEELFVNPVLLKLTQQRGNLDCGGLRYLIVRYGNFFQLVMDVPDGHVSVCVEPTINPLEFEAGVRAVFTGQDN